MENKYLQNQIEAMKLYLENFRQACRLATLQDDGNTSKDEEKVIKKIDSLSEDFIKGLNRLLK